MPSLSQESSKDKAFEVLKINKFTFVNVCFQDESNAVFGVFLQRLSTDKRKVLPPEERSGQIVEPARQLFSSRGVKETKVSDIVTAIGIIAQGTFYLYFITGRSWFVHPESGGFIGNEIVMAKKILLRQLSLL